MCGIAGFTTFPGKRDPSESEQRIVRMTARLAHRGPDGQGHYRDDHVTLGHRRLSILDPDFGAQPMADAYGRFRIVANSEIYNYIELRRELEARGHAFRTRSDTEVLLVWLIEHGEAGLRALDGMFALALWDARECRLLLARDRIGIKPLYYSVTGGNLVFASEMKAMLKHEAVPRSLSPLAVSKFFSFGYVPAPGTIFEDVHKLEPGSFLEFRAGDVRKEIYWDLPLEDRPVVSGHVDEQADRLLRLMRESVRRQLRSDVPVGVFLSGGIDSSAITALAAQESASRLHTFSIGFDQPSYDESACAQEVSRLYGTEHHSEVLTLRAAAELFPEVMARLDEPFADPSILPTYFLSRLASQHVKVVLGGDGGDELFAGYTAFQAHKVVEALSILPLTWRDGLNRIARRIPVSHRYASLEFLAQQFVRGLGLSPEMRFLVWMGFWNNEDKERLLSPDFQSKAKASGGDPFEDVRRYVRQSGLSDGFARLLYLCMKTYFQDGVLAKVDRASMANSLEVRVPYMGNDLVEQVCAMQSFYKLHGLTTKYILKRAVVGLLPRSIIQRRKAGFMMPVALWIQRDLRDVVEDLTSERSLSECGLFDAPAVRRMLRDHLENRRDHRKQIWPLVCFLSWMRCYGGAA